MTKSFRPFLTELLWLTAILIVTILICRLVFMWDFRNGTLDLHLHDTYFVFSAPIIIAPLFFLVTFVLYFIKEIRNRFSRSLPNIILLIAGLLLIVIIAFVNKELIRLGTSVGWTIYSPLSAIPGSAKLNPFAAIVTNTLTVLQLVVTISLLFATYRWGRHQTLSR